MDIVSYLMGQKAGGGGGDTLWDSGWIKEYGAKAEVNDNTVTLNSGANSHYVLIAPPATVDRGTYFRNGDVIKIAIDVKEVSNSIALLAQANCSFEKSSDAWKTSGTSVYVQSAGKAVITVTYTADSVGIKIQAGSGASASATTSGLIEITGLKFNDTLIFGDVTPPSA
jgi:hypothetical protein